MNLNLIAYCIYIFFTVIITVLVGRACHRNGIYFVMECVDNIQIAHSINNLLLVGYYLLNIGYAIISISGWIKIESLPQMLDILTFRTAYIILLLAIVHYINIGLLSLYPTLFKQKQLKT